MSKKRAIALIISLALILSATPVTPINAAMTAGEYVYKGETWKYGLGDAIGWNQNTFKTIGTTGNANWRDASPSGNGELSILESCDPNEDVFILVNTKIVQNTTSIYDVPYLADQMDYIRTETINKTSYPWLNLINAYAQEQYGVNWGTTWPRPCHPAGQLRIKNNDYTPANAQIYNRYTNYETAEVGAQWKNEDRTCEWNRRSFVSRADNVIVTQIEADQDLNLTISMDALTSIQGAPSSGISTLHVLESDENGYAMGFVGKYAITNRIGTKNVVETKFARGGWSTATRIVADGATITETTISGRPALTITGTKSIMLITKVDRQDSGCNTVEDVKAKCYDRLLSDIDNVISKYKAQGKFTYENMLAPHAAIHGAEFNSVRIDLCQTPEEKADRLLTNSELINKQSTEKSTFNKAYIERAYYTGRYALLCSSGYHTARLGGIWNGMWSPDWSGDFTLDANVNLQVSGMATGDMPIANWGYISLVLRCLPDWAENALYIYGAEDAILSGPRTDGTGDAKSFHFLNGYPQLFVNGITDWMLIPLYEYWCCYGNRPVPLNKDIDLEKLAPVLDLSEEDIARIESTGYFDFEQDILYPALVKNMNFWLQFVDERFYKDGAGNNHVNDGTTLSEAIAAGDKDAKYIFAPTFSPENAPSGGNVVAFNSTMDVSAAINSVYMAKTVALSMYPDDPEVAAKIAEWEDFVSKVPTYIYNENGSLKEWLDYSLRDNNRHRHTSHAYAAWPGHEAMTDPELAAGIQQALNDRYSYNATAPESHAHDHRALVEARLGNAEQLEIPLRFLSNMTSANSNYRYQNFLTSHNSNLTSGFVTDLACSYSGIINESLAYSYDGEIKILPALLKDLNKGSITGMMARCRAKLDEIVWDRDAKTASVTITSQKDDNAIKLMCGVPWNKASINGIAQTIKTDALGNAYIELTLDNNETVKVDFTLEPAVVLTGTNSVDPEEEFTVGLSLDTADLSVYAEDITLSYDPQVFEYINTTSADENVSILRSETSDGTVRIIAANIGGINGNNVPVMNVNFKVKKDLQGASSTISIIKADFGIMPGGTLVNAGLSNKAITVGSAPTVDKSELQAAITAAEALYDSAVVGTENGNYRQADKDAFKAAIDAAKAVYEDTDATQAEVNDAVDALNAAKAAFEASVITPTTGDLNDSSTIDVGDLAVVAYYYGKDSSDENWNQIKAADFNKDGKIDIEDLAFIASRMSD